MKTAINIKLFIPLACILCALIFACEFENPWMADILQEKTVKFDTNGGSSIPSQKLYAGQSVQRPANPTKTDCVFQGWYKDNVTFLEPYDFSYIPKKDMTLYAKWDDDAGSEIKVISSVNVTVIGPATGNTPVTDPPSGGKGYTCGRVTWTPNDNIFQKSTSYTAKVTLTATGDYTFASAIDATINGNSAEQSGVTETSITLSYQFPETSQFIISGIKITEQPNKRIYIYEEKLDLFGLEVEISYSNSDSKKVKYDKFEENLISTTPINGADLTVPAHNGKPVKVSVGNLSDNTVNLTVNKAEPSPNDFDYSNNNWEQTIGNVTPIKIKSKAGKTTGNITVIYTKDTLIFRNDEIKTAPANTYTIEIEVTEDDNWNSVNRISTGHVLFIDSVFTTGAALANYLNTLSNNASVTVKLSISDVAGFQAIKSALDNNPGKYVTLDLSGSTITAIPPNAFYTVSGDTGYPSDALAGVIIPSGVQTIGDYAFNGCKNLTSVTIPSGVQTIGDCAFGSCPITSVVIPESVTSIGQWAFDGGGVLTRVEFERSRTDFESGTFGSDGSGNSLYTAYLGADGGAGIYTRTSGTSLTWIKQP